MSVYIMFVMRICMCARLHYYIGANPRCSLPRKCSMNVREACHDYDVISADDDQSLYIFVYTIVIFDADYIVITSLLHYCVYYYF